MKKHGACGTVEYNSWSAMKQRCNYQKHKNWKHYGGKGVKVCKRWNQFENFYQDLGPRPDGCSLERIDREGDYTPENTIWADWKTQARNRSNNARYRYLGRTKTIVEWGEILGLGQSMLRVRLEVLGWSVKRAFTTPAQSRETPKKHTYTIEGKTLTLKEWAKVTGINYRTLLNRINQLGWSPKRAITSPNDSRSRRSN